MKFIEGNWYIFTIGKILTLPTKGDFIMLEHEETGRKMLLNSQYYPNYKFEIGRKIKCKIDKVNCTGQIFLEPEHPYYKEGKSYSFNISNVTSTYENLHILEVIDNSKSIIQTVVHTDVIPEVGGVVDLRVLRIKKGLPILEYRSKRRVEQSLSTHNLLNQIVDFNVLKEISLNQELFVLLVHSKVQALLKVKHYTHYGIKVGDNIQCLVYGALANGLVKVEPKNPWYTLDEIYEFNNHGMERVEDLEGKTSHNLLLYDDRGIKCTVRVPVDMVSSISDKKKVKCKVVGFKKGRPLLEIDQYLT